MRPNYKPSYTTEELLIMIEKAELNDLESIRLLLKEEKFKYSISDLTKIVSAYKKRIKDLVERDIPIMEKFFARFGIKLTRKKNDK